jgi:hypothetical protein
LELIANPVLGLAFRFSHLIYTDRFALLGMGSVVVAEVHLERVEARQYRQGVVDGGGRIPGSQRRLSGLRVHRPSG